jgi:hypothetical protein
MSANLPYLINSLDEAIATIKRLAEIGPALDDGGAIYFQNAIELLPLIAQYAGHVERLSTQLAQCVLPRPHPVEDDQRPNRPSKSFRICIDPWSRRPGPASKSCSPRASTPGGPWHGCPRCWMRSRHGSPARWPRSRQKGRIDEDHEYHRRLQIGPNVTSYYGVIVRGDDMAESHAERRQRRGIAFWFTV